MNCTNDCSTIFTTNYNALQVKTTKRFGGQSYTITSARDNRIMQVAGKFTF
jgi:hypothetical protein